MSPHAYDLLRATRGDRKCPVAAKYILQLLYVSVSFVIAFRVAERVASDVCAPETRLHVLKGHVQSRFDLDALISPAQ